MWIHGGLKEEELSVLDLEGRAEGEGETKETTRLCLACFIITSHVCKRGRNRIPEDTGPTFFFLGCVTGCCVPT